MHAFSRSWSLGWAIFLLGVSASAYGWFNPIPRGVVVPLAAMAGVSVATSLTSRSDPAPRRRVLVGIWGLVTLLIAGLYMAFLGRSLPWGDSVNTVSMLTSGYGVSSGHSIHVSEEVSRGLIAVTLTGLCGGWLAGVAMGRSFSVAVRDAGIWALALVAGAIVSIVAGYVFVGASADLFAPISQRLGIAIGSVAAGATGGVLIGAIGRQTLQSSSHVVSLADASAG